VVLTAPRSAATFARALGEGDGLGGFGCVPVQGRPMCFASGGEGDGLAERKLVIARGSGRRGGDDPGRRYSGGSAE